MTGHSDAVFRTLADPTRRHILDLLVESGPLTVSQLSDEFPRLVTSGISKHLMRWDPLESTCRHASLSIL